LHICHRRGSLGIFGEGGFVSESGIRWFGFGFSALAGLVSAGLVGVVGWAGLVVLLVL
jgi:hypothetical protein